MEAQKRTVSIIVPDCLQCGSGQTVLVSAAATYPDNADMVPTTQARYRCEACEYVWSSTTPTIHNA